MRSVLNTWIFCNNISTVWILVWTCLSLSNAMKKLLKAWVKFKRRNSEKWWVWKTISQFQWEETKRIKKNILDIYIYSNSLDKIYSYPKICSRIRQIYDHCRVTINNQPDQRFIARNRTHVSRNGRNLF